MQEIKLNGDLLKFVQAGLKKATTRKGHKEVKLGDACFVDPENFVNKVNVNIYKIEYVRFYDLSEMVELSRKEGYATGDHLKKALENIYGEIDFNETMTVIYFEPNYSWS